MTTCRTDRLYRTMSSSSIASFTDVSKTACYGTCTAKTFASYSPVTPLSDASVATDTDTVYKVIAFAGRSDLETSIVDTDSLVESPRLNLRALRPQHDDQRSNGQRHALLAQNVFTLAGRLV